MKDAPVRLPMCWESSQRPVAIRFHRWGQKIPGIIDVFSRKGDLIVDYFLGGGTTAVVCKRLERNFIGFEIDRQAYDIAVSRVNETPTPSNPAIQKPLEINL